MDTNNNNRGLYLIIILLVLVIIGGYFLFTNYFTITPKGSSTNAGNEVTQTSSQTLTPSSVPFKITSVDLTVDPSTITAACNTTQNFTYTAIFHIPANSVGGTVNFMWTVNNGRSSEAASTTIAAGEVSKSYTFTSSETLNADHTFPGIAEVMVTTPNEINSSQVKPTGACH